MTRISLTLLALSLAPGALAQDETTADAPSGEPGSVTLNWAIESATDNYGFYLSRSEAETGPYERVNEDLIPGVGTTSERHEFEYVDDTVLRGRQYYYRLYEVGYSGAEELMGTLPVWSRTVSEDIVHERRRAYGVALTALEDDLVSPVVSGEYVLFPHPRRSRDVHLIGSWSDWEEGATQLTLLPNSQILLAEIPLAEIPENEELWYAFTHGEVASGEFATDTTNPDRASDEERGHSVSVFTLAD